MRRLSLFLAVLFVSFSALAQSDHPRWHDLKKGNDRYVAGRLVYANLVAQREAVEEKQKPPVTILSCADSRVPPELMFDESVGALFVVRVAGNVADSFDLASIEYAVSKGWTELIVVIGHQRCGAVEEAVKQTNPPTPSLLALVDRIRASFYGLTECDPQKDLDCAIIANAKNSAKALLASNVIRDAVNAKKLTIMTAYYSLEDGSVKKIE